MAGPMHTATTLAQRRAATAPAHRCADTDDLGEALRVSGGVNRPPAVLDRHSVVALQRPLGNAAVYRLLQRQGASLATAPFLQRYPVEVPCDADCDTLLDWLDTKNPFADKGNWAETTCNYNVRKGKPTVSPYEVDEATHFRVRLKKPRVSVACSVDMPRWKPCNRAMTKAWQAAWGRLRRHEAEHEGIGREHRKIMEEVLKELDIYTDATDRADAVAQADVLVNDDLARLEKEQQDAQKAIDPFRAPFDCPDVGTEDETVASAAGSLGDVVGGSAA